MVKSVHELLALNAEAFLKLQRDNGSFPPGHNGPYYDEELPTRNTGHLIILMLKAYEITQEKKFLDSARKAIAYCLRDEFRPMGATFWVRKNPKFDFCNGLIGQAWMCEALLCAYEHFNEERLLSLSKEIVKLHPFNEKRGLWRSVNVDGSYSIIDATFNHQLWFAAIASYIDDEDIGRQVKRFMDKIPDNLGIYRQGLIIHPIMLPGKRAKLRKLRKVYLTDRTIDHLVHYKEIGYHGFNTYGFALLYQNTKEHSFWSSDSFKKILDFLCSDCYWTGLEVYRPDTSTASIALPHNRYGYAYNPPGIEAAYTLQVFNWYPVNGREQFVGNWLSRQLDKSFNWEEGLMNKNTEDPVTLSSRIYEATRLDNYNIP